MRAKILQSVAILIAAFPLIIMLANFARLGLGANPIEEATHVTGEWGLRFILISLAITPARRFFGFRTIAPLRRTFGLAGFTYACLHLSIWAFLDLGLDLEEILDDVTKRPYVMVGMAAFVILLSLAITSTRGWMKRLGKRWVRLHQAIYVAAILGVVHHFWLTKADYRPAIVHGAILSLLLGARLVWRARQRD